MKKVWIEPGCITCGACEVACSKIFKVEATSTVIKDAPLDEHTEEIKEAAEICPVNVIKYEE